MTSRQQPGETPLHDADRCPTGCGNHVRPRHLMCGLCWALVPIELRKPVYRTWRAYSSAKTGEQIRATRGPYIEARDAAIASVR